MDNWLIFQYHHARVQTKRSLLRRTLRGPLTQLREVSNGMTRKGRWTRALVAPG